MYKCLECGKIFRDPQKWIEDGSEYMSGCPSCKGDYEDACKCKLCGCYYLHEELHGGACYSCIENRRTDIDVCFKIGKNDSDNIDLNCFLSTMFRPEEIEEILIRELREAHNLNKLDFLKFIESDIDWFGKMLVEEEIE